MFAAGDAVLGADLAVRAVAAGRLASVSIDQYLSGRPVTGERERVNVFLRPLDEDELAELFRRVERAPRVRSHEREPGSRKADFEEIDPGLSPEEAVAESRRCLSCGCRKAEGCHLRQLAAEYGADPLRFTGERRRFSRDLGHPDIIYEPGKCILCDACVQIAAREGEALGLAPVGRGFEVRVAVPFGEPLAAGLTRAAERCVMACPTGALALRTERACDLCSACPVGSVPRSTAG